MKNKRLGLIFLVVFLSFGCGGLLHNNERISDSEILEDFGILEKELNLRFEIKEVPIDKYKAHMKGADSLLQDIDKDNKDYFDNGLGTKDIRTISRELNGDYENYDLDFLEEHNTHFSYNLSYESEVYNLQKPKEWKEIKDWKEKKANYFYVKSLGKIKQFSVYYEEPELGGITSQRILLTGIKEDKIRVLIYIGMDLDRIPHTDDPIRGKRYEMYDIELDLYNDSVKWKKYYTFTNNIYKDNTFREFHYE